MNNLYVSQKVTYKINKYGDINNNVLICGSPGTGKTRNIVIPNLLLNTENSFVINDSKGLIYKEYKDYFIKQGFKIKHVDFINLTGHYNIFDSVKTEYDILKIAHLITYMDVTPNMNRDPFWDEETEMCLSACISFMFEFLPKDRRTLSTLNDILINSTTFIDEIDKEILYLSRTEIKEKILEAFNTSRTNILPIDKLFYTVYKKNPNSFAVRQYKKFCTSPEKTFGTIIATTLSKMGIYDTDKIREFSKSSDFSLSNIGQEKTAFFISVSDNDRTMDTLANILYTQIIQELVTAADRTKTGRLPIDVDLYFDDFATSVKIIDFPRMISSFRSRGISSIVLVQSESQLFSLYQEEAKTIIGSSSVYIYLGTMDMDTIKNMSFRMNLPINEIIGLPQEKMIIHKQGSMPITDYCLKLEDILKSLTI